MSMEHLPTPDLTQQQYIESLFSHLEWAAAAPRVLAIGRGAVEDAYRYVETYGFSRLQIDGIDLSQEALTTTGLYTEGKQQLQREQFDFTQVAPRRHYHLIWASDLLDILDDNRGKRLLLHLLQAVAPGGEVIIGSYAGAARLRNLARACGVAAEAMTFRRSQDSSKLFLHIKQKQAPVIGSTGGLATQRVQSIRHLN